MNTQTAHAQPPHPQRRAPVPALWPHERACLEGLECSEVSWEEWDASVSAMDEVEPLPH